MQIYYARVPTEEHQRRYNEGLCFYCGQSGHMQSTCQNLRRNQVTRPKVSITTVLSTSNNFSLPTKVYFNDQSESIAALIDSGSALNLIHKVLMDRLEIPTIHCVPTITVTAINSHPIDSSITHQTVQVPLQVGLFHTELPEEYYEFYDVFSKSKATQLPPHRSWDCVIDLLPRLGLKSSNQRRG